MIAAFISIKWVKWGAFALIAIAFFALWLLMITADAKRESAESKLETTKQELANALNANQVSQATIDALTADNEYINRLLIDRKRKSLKAKKVLRDEIQLLEQQMDNIECDIPIDVTERLRSSY
ncbi:hypothetical protein L4C54_12830 [Vibrio lamellibrachiae]|uniref:hypothetical protein n=1 Tax=Vibrio lamellibrachiae TaxID=2910253 RepID=UPI003D11F460